MHDDVAVATITWARDAEEDRLLRRSLTLLAGTRLPVAVADKATSPEFTTFVTSLAGFHVTAPAGGSLVGQVQASLREAERVDRRFILYTESDKEGFFGVGLDRFLTLAPRSDDVGIVMAARTEGSFATFPPFQQFTERAINDVWFRLSGQAGDYSYGPLLLNRAIVPHLYELGPEVGWGWRHFAVGVARRERYRIMLVEGDHPCPPDQRTETEQDKFHRLRQLSQNIQGVVLSMSPRAGHERS